MTDLFPKSGGDHELYIQLAAALRGDHILVSVRATKTTLLLADDLRAELKELALRRGTTVTELVAEGARLVLARGRGAKDAAELRRRAQRLRKNFRRGLYQGPASSDLVDDLVYSVSRRSARAARSR